MAAAVYNYLKIKKQETEYNYFHKKYLLFPQKISQDIRSTFTVV